MVADCLAECFRRPAALAWLVSPSYAQSEVMDDDLKWMLRSAGIPFDENRTDRRITVVGGARVYFKSADQPDNLRGSGLDYLGLDEAARIGAEAWAALRPATADRCGRVTMISSPRGRDPVFHAAYSRALAGVEGHAAWRFPSSVNPYLPASEIEAAKRELPTHVFKSEFLAEFLADAASVFQSWEACKVAGKPEGPRPGASYSIGVDLAKRQDFTAIIAIDEETGRLAHKSRFHQLPWPAMREKIKAVVSQFPGKLIVDSTGIGDVVIDELRRDGLDPTPYQFGNESKARIIEGLIVAFDKGELSIPEEDSEDLAAELSAYEWEYSPGGKMKYNAPSGLHDDLVIALALACWGRRKLARFDREVGWTPAYNAAGMGQDFRTREGLPGGLPAWAVAARRRMGVA
jgi:hypothetical protein